MIAVEETWEAAQHSGAPLIADAAAEDDIRKYVLASDLAIYSGSKAIEGPTSGIVGGKRKYVEMVKAQFHGIGRSMKVGKETTFGLQQALDEYMNKPEHSAREGVACGANGSRQQGGLAIYTRDYGVKQATSTSIRGRCSATTSTSSRRR